MPALLIRGRDDGSPIAPVYVRHRHLECHLLAASPWSPPAHVAEHSSHLVADRGHGFVKKGQQGCQLSYHAHHALVVA
jgi:hypothetical protein